MMSGDRATIAVIGGTGSLGTGLSLRWARAGHTVRVGSRRPEAAAEAAAAMKIVLSGLGAGQDVAGFGNVEAAQEADIVVLTVPYAQAQDVLGSIRDAVRGKILIDATVPLVPPKVGTVHLPPDGSAAMAAQALLGNDVRVVSAFQNVAADKLRSLEPLDCDVLVSGDDKAAREAVLELVTAAGLRGFSAGPLANSVVAESLTSVLITINRQFKCQSGIRIVGLP